MPHHCDPAEQLSTAPLPSGPLALADEGLLRELRSLARSCTLTNPNRVDVVAATLLRIACMRGLPSVRADLAATTNARPAPKEHE
jgi:hypothetical protein